MAEQQGLKLQQVRICLDVVAIGTEISGRGKKKKGCLPLEGLQGPQVGRDL